VNPTRRRCGACAWLLTLQFFVVETLAQSRFGSAYSRVDDVISVLGSADSAARQLMNASFVIQGALILVGVLLLRPALQHGAGQAAAVLLGAAALGVLLVGVFPMDGNATVHAIGAGLYLVGGGLGLIALAYAVRPRSEAVGTALALLGLVGTAATVFFLTGVTAYLGEGGTERAAAYVLPIGLALAGAALLRRGRLLAGEAGPPRGQGRALERAEREEQARRRDEALEAAASRPAADRTSAGGGTSRGRAATDDDDDHDPWAAAPRDGY
jgi:hypothetical membrane protein